MLLHDLKDVRNGRVISGQKELTLDEDYGGRTLYVYRLGSTFKGKLHANPATYPVVSLSTKEEIEKWAKENNFAEVRFMNVTDSKTKDDWGNILQDKIERAIKENKSEYEINKLKEDLKQWIKDQRQLQGGRIKDSKSTKDSKTKDADYKDYYDVGKDVGLSGEKLIQYVEYMRQRWPEKEKVQGELNGYCKEWARRFAKGDAWKLSDLSGQRILERMGITDSKSTKDQIAELESQKEQAKKMGYGTDAYDAAIANLQKDAFSQPLTVEEIKSLFQSIDPTYAKMLSGVVTSKQMAVRKGLEVGLKLSSEGARFKDSDDTCDAKEVVQEGDIQGRHYQIYKENDTFFGNVEGISHYFQANTHSQVLKNIIDSIKTSSKDESDIFTQDPLTEKGKEILEAMKKQYGEKKGEDIFYASKNKGIITGVDAKDSDIIINISENPDKFEEKAFDRIHYNGYNIKQIKETGEFDIYDLGGAIIGHTATFELAKIFIDNKGNSIIGQAE